MRLTYHSPSSEDFKIFGSLYIDDNTINSDYEQLSLWDFLWNDGCADTKTGHNTTPADLMPKIKDVYYNGPATIVWWDDGTKTVVRCQAAKGDTYDKEKGLAMAIIKKVYGNTGNFNDIFRKWGCWDE